MFLFFQIITFHFLKPLSETQPQFSSTLWITKMNNLLGCIMHEGCPVALLFPSSLTLARKTLSDFTGVVLNLTEQRSCEGRVSV